MEHEITDEELKALKKKTVDLILDNKDPKFIDFCEKFKSEIDETSERLAMLLQSTPRSLTLVEIIMPAMIEGVPPQIPAACLQKLSREGRIHIDDEGNVICLGMLN